MEKHREKFVEGHTEYEGSAKCEKFKDYNKQNFILFILCYYI